MTIGDTKAYRVTTERPMMVPPEDTSTQDPPESSSTLTQGQTPSSTLSKQNIATIVELQSLLAAKRTNSSLHPDVTCGTVTTEFVRPALTPVTVSAQTDAQKRQDDRSIKDMIASYIHFCLAFGQTS